MAVVPQPVRCGEQANPGLFRQEDVSRETMCTWPGVWISEPRRRELSVRGRRGRAGREDRARTLGYTRIDPPRAPVPPDGHGVSPVCLHSQAAGGRKPGERRPSGRRRTADTYGTARHQSPPRGAPVNWRVSRETRSPRPQSTALRSAAAAGQAAPVVPLSRRGRIFGVRASPDDPGAQAARDITGPADSGDQHVPACSPRAHRAVSTASTRRIGRRTWTDRRRGDPIDKA